MDYLALNALWFGAHINPMTGCFDFLSLILLHLTQHAYIHCARPTDAEDSQIVQYEISINANFDGKCFGNVLLTAKRALWFLLYEF